VLLLLLVLALVEAELDDLGANAFATAKVASMLPEPPEPEPPAPTANMVESGVFPIELTTRASVDDIFFVVVESNGGHRIHIATHDTIKQHHLL